MSAKGRNIFIEGMPGSGKSTLLGRLEEKFSGGNTYREGDISPVELAWCAYMTDAEYAAVCARWPELKTGIDQNTRAENGRRIVAYTKVNGADGEFYHAMEAYEIYGGRRGTGEFCDIVRQRFESFGRVESGGTVNIFECSFLQNILDEMLLFGMCDEGRILDFYRGIIAGQDMDSFRLLRLVPEDIEASLAHVRAERVDENGAPVWFDGTLGYMAQSPYGRAQGMRDFDDFAAYYARRAALEELIAGLLPEKNYLRVTSRNYDIDEVMQWLR